MNIKKRIVISSTLKPVDDIRSYRKIGDSLGKTNNYDVKIIGYGSKMTSTNPNVELISTGVFNRLSLKRVFLPFRILGIIIKLKPDLLIIATHELLLISYLLKILKPKCKIVYDMRENYYANIRFQKIFPFPINFLLAHWVRLKEFLSTPLLSHLLVAEKGYVEEIKFIKRNHFKILENKSIYSNQQKTNQNRDLQNLVFTGNLSVNSGVLTAIKIFNQIKVHYPTVRLQIIGHSPEANFRNRLQELVHDLKDVTLISNKEPIPYSQIKAAIETADLGLVSYQINESNVNCIPTKVFEYLAMKLPFISEKDSKWYEYCKSSNMSFPFENDQIDTSLLLNWYQKIDYNYHINQYTWTEESKKIVELTNKLLL